MGFLRIESQLKAKAAGPPPAFPGNIAGTVLWVASDGTKTLVNDGTNDRLSQWNDGSANSNHLTQATVANRPVWVTNQLNTFPVADFRGDASTVFHWIAGTTATATFWPVSAGENAEIWIAFRPETLRTGSHLVNINSNATTNALQIRWTTTDLQFAYRSDTGLESFGTPITVDTWYIARLRKAGTTVTGYLNGLQVGTSGATPARTHVLTGGGTTPIVLGGREDDTNCIDGKILECWIGNQLLSTSDAAALEAYLFERYGLILQFEVSPAVGGKTLYAAGDSAMTVDGPGTWTVTPTSQFASTVTLWGPGGSAGGAGASAAGTGDAGTNTTFGALLTAGAGGTTSGVTNNTAGTAGAAGTASGGTTNTSGSAGGVGTIGATTKAGDGGSSPNGGAAVTGNSSSTNNTTLTGIAGNAPGGGGTGAGRMATSANRRASGGGGGGGYVLKTYAAGDLTAGTGITLTVGDSGAGGTGDYAAGGKGAAGRAIILPAGGTVPGTLKTAAQEPIASGLVFFAGSAPDGSSLLMLDQIASNAVTLNQNQAASAPTLTRVHPGNAAWRGGDIVSGGSLLWPQSAQLKGLTNDITVWGHVSWDSGASSGFTTFVTAPHNDTTYADLGPWSFRLRQNSTSTDDWRIFASLANSAVLETTVNTTVNIWNVAGDRCLAWRRSGSTHTVSVGTAHTPTTGVSTENLTWAAGASHICAFAAHRNYSGSAAFNNSDGGLLALAIWNRALSDTEIAALNTNPLLLQHQ